LYCITLVFFEESKFWTLDRLPWWSTLNLIHRSWSLAAGENNLGFLTARESPYAYLPFHTYLKQSHLIFIFIWPSRGQCAIFPLHPPKGKPQPTNRAFSIPSISLKHSPNQPSPQIIFTVPTLSDMTILSVVPSDSRSHFGRCHRGKTHLNWVGDSWRGMRRFGMISR